MLHMLALAALLLGYGVIGSSEPEFGCITDMQCEEMYGDDDGELSDLPMAKTEDL